MTPGSGEERDRLFRCPTGVMARSAFDLALVALLSLPFLLLYFHYARTTGGTTARAHLFVTATTLLGTRCYYGLFGIFFGKRGLITGLLVVTPVLLASAAYGLAFHALLRPGRLVVQWSEIKGAPVAAAALVFVPWAMILLLGLAWLLVLWLPAGHRPFGKGLTLFACLAYGASILYAMNVQSLAVKFRFESLDSCVRYYGYLPSMAYDLRDALRTPDAKAMQAKLEADLKANPPGSILAQERFTRIFIFQVESLDWNIINAREGGQWVAPFLHEMATLAPPVPVRPNHESISGSSGADFQVIAGLRPILGVPVYRAGLGTLPDGLPAWLGRRGVPMYLFHGNIPQFWGRGEGLFRLGVQHFYSSDEIFRVGPSRWGINDRDVLNYLGDWADRQKGPFVAMAITLSMHVPFNLVDNPRFPGSADAVRYMNVVNYFDQALAAFAAREMGPDTAFLVFGDHSTGLRTATYTSFPGDTEVVPFLSFTGRGGAWRSIENRLECPSGFETVSIHAYVKSLLKD